METEAEFWMDARNSFTENERFAIVRYLQIRANRLHAVWETRKNILREHGYDIPYDVHPTALMWEEYSRSPFED